MIKRKGAKSSPYNKSCPPLSRLRQSFARSNRYVLLMGIIGSHLDITSEWLKPQGHRHERPHEPTPDHMAVPLLNLRPCAALTEVRIIQRIHSNKESCFH